MPALAQAPGAAQSRDAGTQHRDPAPWTVRDTAILVRRLVHLEGQVCTSGRARPASCGVEQEPFIAGESFRGMVRLDLILAQLQTLGAEVPAGQDKPDDFDPNYLNKIVD